MARYAIVTDLNRCVGCLGCVVACKSSNGVPVGQFWNKVVRMGPTPREEGGNWPDVDMYFLPMSCQHCATPECVTVCPTGASMKMEDGTVQVDKEVCIGCGACLTACPYNVRYINADTGVAEKCTMCVQAVEQGELPQCVSQCGGMARWFGDLDEGVETFRGACDETLGDFIEPYEESDVYKLPDMGNGPEGLFILRRMAWQEEGTTM